MYTEQIERIQRFKLALRMGIPIFLLAGILFFSLLTQYFETVPYQFVIIIVGLMAIAVYFQFFLIYQAFQEQITDATTHTFTVEYFKKLFTKRLEKNPQSLMLYSIDNLYDVNTRLGIKNGNRLLYKSAQYIDEFLQEKGVVNPVISRIKGGDFIVMIEGARDEHRLLFDLLCTKISSSVINGIEVNSSGAIIDTQVSQELDQLIDRLFELQEERRASRLSYEEESDNLSDIQKNVLEALNSERFSIMGQRVQSEDSDMIDISVKLIDKNEKLIHQKRFLPIINRQGMRRFYDLAKIRALLQQKSSFTAYRCALNIASESLRDRNFADDVRSLFEAYGDLKFAFIVEEREYFSNLKFYDATLQSYRDLGIEIILDGLGTNHTTQLYLKDLHIDGVRFDGSFGKNITNERYYAMVKGLSTSAKALGVKTWIRMIEDETAYKRAKTAGIELFSGNYIGRVASIETIREENE